LSGGYTAAKKALIGISALALVSTMDDKEQRDEYIAAAKMLAMGAEKAGVISRN
jgi:preprotein translocase subunit Sss1